MSTPLRNLRFACLASLLALTSSLLPGQATPPGADTFVSSAVPSHNYGNSIILVVQPGATSYLRFNLATLPTGATVSRATLRLYVDAVLKSGTFDVYQLNNSWSENTLTYNTPPPPLGISATGGHPISVSASSLNQFFLIDITSLVQGWVSGAIANNGVALASTDTGNFSFDSKESLFTGNGPELEIVLNGPAGPAGAQGPIGATGAAGPLGPAGSQGAAGPQGLQGVAGPVGPQGIPGPVGFTGPQGNAGPQGAAGQGFDFRAAFDSAATYAAYDVVTFNGSSYLAKGAINPGGPAPDTNSNWNVMAQQGAAGSPGATGSPGPAGQQGPMGFQGPPGPVGPMPTGAALTTAPNTFGASQTVNGYVILTGTGNGIVFPDGTALTSAAASQSTAPSGSLISSISSVAPPGYSLLFTLTQGSSWLTSARNPKRLNDSADALLNGRIVILGGDDGNVLHGVFGNVEGYDPSTNTWAALPNMPTPRNYLAAAVANGKLYAVGGADANGTPTSPVEVYDGTFGGWSTAPSLQTARFSLAAAELNGTIYALGGIDLSSTLPVNIVEAYTPPTIKQTSWQTVAPMPTARYRLTAVGLNGKLYAISGEQPDYINNTGSSTIPSTAVEVYDPASDVWSAAAPVPTAHDGGEAHVLNGKIYVTGGIVNPSNPIRNSNIDIYDPTTNSWSTIIPQQQSGVTYQTQTFDPNTTYFELDGDGDIDHFFGFPIYTYVKN